MRIVITEEQKKKFFIPRKLSSEDSRYVELNNSQPIIDGKRINQYDPEGRKIGYWEEYYDDGQLSSKGNYINGNRDGYWEEYWSDGKLESKGSYINGKRDGIWEEYWNNGNLRIKGSYFNDKKDGIWEYFLDGEFWYEGEWNYGKYIRDIRI